MNGDGEGTFTQRPPCFPFTGTPHRRLRVRPVATRGHSAPPVWRLGKGQLGPESKMISTETSLDPDAREAWSTQIRRADLRSFNRHT